MDWTKIISITQIVISALIIVAILLQRRGAGGSAITGGTGGASYYSKRGFEKVLFGATIVLVGLFFILAVISILPLR